MSATLELYGTNQYLVYTSCSFCGKKYDALEGIPKGFDECACGAVFTHHRRMSPWPEKQSIPYDRISKDRFPVSDEQPEKPIKPKNDELRTSY